MVMDQLSLTYNELEAYAFGTKAATEKQIAVKTYERKRQSGNVLDVVPEGTPTEVVEHRLVIHSLPTKRSPLLEGRSDDELDYSSRASEKAGRIYSCAFRLNPHFDAK